jgi:hypothetical protein
MKSEAEDTWELLKDQMRVDGRRPIRECLAIELLGGRAKHLRRPRSRWLAVYRSLTSRKSGPESAERYESAAATMQSDFESMGLGSNVDYVKQRCDLNPTGLRIRTLSCFEADPSVFEHLLDDAQSHEGGRLDSAVDRLLAYLAQDGKTTGKLWGAIENVP